MHKKLMDQISSFKYHRAEIIKILKEMNKNPENKLKAKISLIIKDNRTILQKDVKTYHW